MGTKNYAYRLIANKGEKTVCKVRCITVNYHVLQLVNFVVIRAMILEEGEPVVYVHSERKIKRKRKAVRTVALLTESEVKSYRLSFFKMRRMHEHSCISLGWGRGERSVSQPGPPYVTTFNRSTRFRICCADLAAQAIHRSAYVYGRTSTLSVPCIYLTVVSSGAIVIGAPSHSGSWPRRKTFI